MIYQIKYGYYSSFIQSIDAPEEITHCFISLRQGTYKEEKDYIDVHCIYVILYIATRMIKKLKI